MMLRLLTTLFFALAAIHTAQASDTFIITDQTFLPGNVGLSILNSHRMMLEREMNTPVKIYSKSNGCQLLQSAKQQHSDILVITPQLVPTVTQQYGYLPLLKVDQKLTINLVSKKNKPIKSLSDLRGKTFATMTPGLTITSIANNAIDSIPGLRAEIEFIPIERTKSILAMINNDVDVIAMTALLYNELSPQFKDELHYFPIESEFPISVLVFHNQSDRKKVSRYRDIIANMKPLSDTLVTFSALTEQDINGISRILKDKKWDDINSGCNI
ncbi:PhnD/SsuA/transferrin family substrate-binding protein [Oceanicoccus sagamiensis]|uniref:Solute-binding protein family 3/N-terminal domain-containing protein n=1 Tax=Oceanicoccus sagamiensis TaxID=716816 RepID=A0A1X9NBY3_9GAMM|nr:PhnD/SsuA/transferrin family substrate-binding protein [Oceanicoccus sagamiensis]ARN74691.1 hypothetical protein BST96_11510 [Oceanicoccus sagamiensis]